MIDFRYVFYRLNEDYYYHYYCLANKAAHIFIFSATSAEPVKVVWYFGACKGLWSVSTTTFLL